MLLMGDEVRRAQCGNNNAYCLDDETTWFDWSAIAQNADLYRFVRLLIELRNSPLIGAYFVLVPAYTVAAWAQDREAFAGLVLFIAGAAVSELIIRRGQAGGFAGAAFTVCAAWGAAADVVPNALGALVDPNKLVD